MTLPTELHIGGMTYRVESGVEHLRSDSDERLCGQIDYVAGVIKLADGLGPTRVRQTLMHEIVHGIANAACMYPSEDDVDRMASGLIAVFRENPGLVKFFFGDDE